MSPLLYLLIGAVVGAAIVGLLVTFRVRKYHTRALINLPDPEITEVQCLSTTHVRIKGTIDPPPAGAILVQLHVASHDDPAHTVGATPDAGAIPYPPPAGTTFQIDHPHPTAGLTGPPDLAQVWAEYKVFTHDGMSFQCPYGGSGSGSGSGSGAMFRATRAVTAAGAAQLEAIPRAYRVSPDLPAASGDSTRVSGEDLAANLDTVLRYAPQASTPVEPLWRAGGESGAVRELTLCLLHRAGGFGAVLSAVCVVGGREVRITWVTSEWRFHATNRLACESVEAGVPPLTVRPA